MTARETDPTHWSQATQDLTRRIISSGEWLAHTSDGLAMKHWEGAYGLMSVADLMADRMRITDRASGEIREFADVEALIAAGWIAD